MTIENQSPRLGYRGRYSFESTHAILLPHATRCRTDRDALHRRISSGRIRKHACDKRDSNLLSIDSVNDGCNSIRMRLVGSNILDWLRLFGYHIRYPDKLRGKRDPIRDSRLCWLGFTASDSRLDCSTLSHFYVLQNHAWNAATLLSRDHLWLTLVTVHFCAGISNRQ